MKAAVMNKERWDSTLNSIADGIELRLNYNMEISDIAIKETSQLAQRLNIPEKDIQNWAEARKSRHSKIIQNLESLLNLLKNNAAVQKVLCNFIPLGGIKTPPGYDKWKMN